MKTVAQLYNGFYLDKKSANSQISDGSIPLRVAPIRQVKDYKHIEIDYEHFAFAEKHKYFHGLKTFLIIEKPKLPTIFIFDNHNHAITFRYDIIYTQNIKDVELIHIDQHSDCRENKNILKINKDKNCLKKVFTFCNNKCNVGNFIPPAIQSGIIKSQNQIRSNTALQNLKIDKNYPFILDIDLDFCLNGLKKDELNYESIQILKKVFNKIGKYALGITIATSPYFLDQELAINIVENLLSK